MTETTPTTIDPKRTALVLIDLQHGITSLPLAPRSGPDIVSRTLPFAQKFRDAGGLVVAVHVGWHPDFGDALKTKVDQAMSHNGALPENWMEFMPGVVKPGDITIAKRQWGAFHGTELDLQLRRRGRDTIILSGIATNLGVESTARCGWELGYQMIFAEDLCTSLGAEMHAFAFANILPRLGLVRSSEALSF